MNFNINRLPTEMATYWAAATVKEAPQTVAVNLDIRIDDKGRIVDFRPSGHNRVPATISTNTSSACPSCSTALNLNVILHEPYRNLHSTPPTQNCQLSAGTLQFVQSFGQICFNEIKREPTTQAANYSNVNYGAGLQKLSSALNNWPTTTTTSSVREADPGTLKHEPEIQISTGWQQNATAQPVEVQKPKKKRKSQPPAPKVVNNLINNPAPMMLAPPPPQAHAGPMAETWKPPEEPVAATTTNKKGKKKLNLEKYKGSVCPICYQTFPVEKVMRQHLNEHDLVCRLCTPHQQLSNKTELKRHAREHHFKLHPKYHLSEKCPKCGHMIILTRHQSHVAHCIANDQGEPRCNICQKLCADWKTVKRHIKFVHTDTEIPCEFCDKKFRDKVAFREHQLAHELNDPRPFKCMQCTVAYSSKRSLNSHLQEKHAISKTYKQYRKFKKVDAQSAAGAAGTYQAVSTG